MVAVFFTESSAAERVRSLDLDDLVSRVRHQRHQVADTVALRERRLVARVRYVADSDTQVAQCSHDAQYNVFLVRTE